MGSRASTIMLATAALLVVALVSATSAADRIEAFASIPPQAYLIERVGGDLVRVSVLVQPGQSPHTFEPSPSLASALSKSDVCFSIGLPFEDQLIRDVVAANPDLLVVDSIAGLETHGMDSTAGTHAHDADSTVGTHGSDSTAGLDKHGDDATGSHHHETDPHVWLSPRAAAKIAGNVRDGLAGLDPEGIPLYDENLARLTAELAELDSEIAETLAPYRGMSFFVFHPAYGYFAREYGLKQIAIEVEGREPGPRDLASVVSEAKERRARTLFLQPQHSSPVAETAAREIGAEIEMLDPLGRDYFAMMRQITQKLSEALAGESRAKHPSPSDQEAE